MSVELCLEDRERIAKLIQDIADESCRKGRAGTAIGVIYAGEEFTAVSGWADVASQQPVSETTIFEIGSLSKLFTSLLLAIAVTKQEIGLDDPVQVAFDQQVTLPTDGKSQITFRSLANHRSSLPRLPDDLLEAADMENPYTHYDHDLFYAALNRVQLAVAIGSRFVYSNFGVGLLGHALGKLAGSDYPTALKQRVLLPLGMHDTSTGAMPEQEKQLATTYLSGGKPTKHWDFTESLTAAGGIRSSLVDMIKFLRANVYPAASGLETELSMMRQPSELPKYDGQLSANSGSWLTLITWYVVPAVLYLFIFGSGVAWLTGWPGLSMFLIVMVPTAVAVCLWGRFGGALMLGLTAGFSWWLSGASVSGLDWANWISALLFGLIFLYLFSPKMRSLVLKHLHGEGRLAWMSSQIGTSSILWHNGQVGGSASYLGIVPEREIGVVVLTNTGKLADPIGGKLLTRLLKLKADKRRMTVN